MAKDEKGPQKMTFTDAQLKELDAPLARAHVKQREQSGRKFSYIEGWVAISEANRIFGFGNWSRETVEFKCVAEREREIGQNKNPGWSVSYIAKVRVSVWGEGASVVIREGTGAGHGIDRDLGQAHESAIKEAETDAMKRSLMSFGNPFGLALYDKEQAGVEDAPKPAPRTDAAPPKPPASAPSKPSGDDKKEKAIAWGRAEIAKVDAFKDLKAFDAWRTPEFNAALKRLEHIDPKTYDNLCDAIDRCLTRLNPISA